MTAPSTFAQSPKKHGETYCCAHCKTKLFTSNELLEHDPAHLLPAAGKRSGVGSPRSMHSSLGSGFVPQPYFCPGQHFIKPMEWINDATGHQGFIQCPKKQCSVRIGAYSYSGLKCKCGKVFTPGFLLYSDRVIEVGKQLVMPPFGVGY